MTTPRPFLTTTEAAERLDVHPETVRRACVSGEIDAQWTGHAWAIHLDAVRDWQRRELLRASQRRVEAEARMEQRRRIGHQRKLDALRALHAEVHTCSICGREIRNRGAFVRHEAACERKQQEEERTRRRAELTPLIERLEMPPDALPVGWVIETPYGWQMQVDGRAVQLEVVEGAVLHRD